jgi:hypothetical protein
LRGWPAVARADESPRRAKRRGVDPLHATARSLLVDAATADVVRRFRAAGVAALVLKGPVLARWLYDDGAARPYADSDLLIRPADWAGAEALLPALGFAPVLTQRDLPQPLHADTWRRERDAIELDLHRTLPGIGADNAATWHVLSHEMETMSIGGVQIATLGPGGRALHLALNAAYDGAGSAKGLADLERGLDRCGQDVWAKARDLAESLDALPAFGAGLRLLPRGRDVASAIGLEHNTSVEVGLRAMSPPQVALGLNRLVTTSGVGAKLTFLARKLVPSRRFMLMWSPLARRGTLGMAAAYLWRPVWLYVRAGPALRALRGARRETREAASSSWRRSAP